MQGKINHKHGDRRMEGRKTRRADGRFAVRPEGSLKKIRSHSQT